MSEAAKAAANGLISADDDETAEGTDTVLLAARIELDKASAEGSWWK